MSNIKKMLLASVSLFNILTFNSNVMGMDISQLNGELFIYNHSFVKPGLYVPYDLKYFNKIDLEEIKEKGELFHLLKQGFVELNENGEFYFSRSNYDLDDSYAISFDALLNRENYENLIVENDKLPTSDIFNTSENGQQKRLDCSFHEIKDVKGNSIIVEVEKDELSASEQEKDEKKTGYKYAQKLGYKVFYLMLKNMCMKLLENNKKVNEECLKCKLHGINDLTSDYVKNYIKKSLLNGRKVYLRNELSSLRGLLFDGNIFIPNPAVFPRFSCEISNDMVTFRFFKKQNPDNKKFMIQIRQSYDNNFEVSFYDQRGENYFVSGGNDSWESVTKRNRDISYAITVA